MPAAHAEHTASELAVHAVPTCCPGQVLQLEHWAALDVLVNVYPAEHAGHTVLAVALQLTLL